MRTNTARQRGISVCLPESRCRGSMAIQDASCSTFSRLFPARTSRSWGSEELFFCHFMSSDIDLPSPSQRQICGWWDGKRKIECGGGIERQEHLIENTRPVAIFGERHCIGMLSTLELAVERTRKQIERIISYMSMMRLPTGRFRKLTFHDIYHGLRCSRSRRGVFVAHIA